MVDRKLNMGQQCTLMAVKNNSILGSKSVQKVSGYLLLFCSCEAASKTAFSLGSSLLITRKPGMHTTCRDQREIICSAWRKESNDVGGQGSSGCCLQLHKSELQRQNKTSLQTVTRCTMFVVRVPKLWNKFSDSI